MKKRIGYIDVAKGIGILLVVLSHAYFPLRNFSFMFFMQFFFFISGVLYSDKDTQHPFKYIKKKLKTLYVPFVIYNLLIMALHNIFLKLNFYTNNPRFKGTIINKYTFNDFFISIIEILTFDNTEQLARPLWFIVALFSTSIIFSLLKYFIDKLNRRKFILSTTIFILFLIGYFTHLPRFLSSALVGLLFYYLGYIYKNYQNRIALKLVPALFCVCIVFLFSKFTYVNMMPNIYTSPLTMFISSILGVYMTIYFSKAVSSVKVGIALEYCGRNSLIILATHLIFFKLVNIIEIFTMKKEYYLIASYPVYITDNYWWILYSVVGVCFPLLLDLVIKEVRSLLQRNKLLRYFQARSLLGKEK